MRCQVTDPFTIARIEENAIEPASSSIDKIRIVTKYFRERLQLARVKRLLVFRHQYNLTTPLDPDLINELLERISVSQVDHCIRFASVTVATGGDRDPEGLGHFD